MTPALASRFRIRDLNDAFRTAGPVAGQWVLTRGVHQMGGDFISLATRAVQGFTGFHQGNDPYGEHDFGSFNLAGETLFWKIDAYDQALEYGSEDPANPSATRRILTIMLASEY